MIHCRRSLSANLIWYFRMAQMSVGKFIAWIDPIGLAQAFRNKFIFSFSFDHPIAVSYSYVCTSKFIWKKSMPLGNNLKSISIATISKRIRKLSFISTCVDWNPIACTLTTHRCVRRCVFFQSYESRRKHSSIMNYIQIMFVNFSLIEVLSLFSLFFWCASRAKCAHWE